MTRTGTRAYMLCALLTAACSGGGGSPPLDAVSDAGADASCNGPCKISLLAGTPGGRGGVDGVGDAARFATASSLTRVGDDIFVADLRGKAVRRLGLASAEVTTFAGQLLSGAGLRQYTDGRGQTATFLNPYRIAAVGDTLYVADYDHLRRISASGDVSTEGWISPNTVFSVAAHGEMLAIAADATVGLYDTRTGIYSALAGSSTYGIVDGQGASAGFGGPNALVFADANTLYVADSCVVRRITVDTGTVTTIAGRSVNGGAVCGVSDGPASTAVLQRLWGITTDGASVWLVERASAINNTALSSNYGRVRRLDLAADSVTSIAGTLPPAPARPAERDGAASEAVFFMPWDVLSIDKALYVSTDAAVRKIENNTVSTVAGTRVSSELRTPTAIAVSGDYAYVGLAGSNGLGRVELASGVFEQLRAYDETDFPIYYIFAMTAVDSTLYLMSESALFAYDIPTGKTTKLWDLMPATFSPGCLVADGDNLYFGGLDLSVDPYAYKLLKLPRAGGNASVVVRSEAIRVSGNAVLHDGALYLANAKQVSRIDLQTSQVTTAAGGAQGGCAAGVGENARFGQITGITSDGKYVYLGDRGCHTLWRMDPKSQLVEHVAGDKANATFAGGLGREAGLNDPTDIAYDAASKSLIICDSFDNIVYRAAAPTAP